MHKYYEVQAEERHGKTLVTIRGFSHFGQGRRGRLVAYYRIPSTDVDALQDDLRYLIGSSYRIRQSR